MKAAVITGKKNIEVREVERPAAGKGEVLIRVTNCAICTWEQRVYQGMKQVPFPFVGGHEVAGIIEAVGADVNEEMFHAGQEVAVRTFNNCGKCYYCRKGKENLCSEFGSFSMEGRGYYGQGGLGEYIVADARDVFVFTEDIPLRHGAFAEPLACVVNSVARGKIQLGNDVLIIGAGIMGLLHLMVAKLQGARVIVSDPDTARRKEAKELGAAITLNPREEDIVKSVQELTGGRGADVVFNTTPIAEVAQQAVQTAGKLGRVVMYSSFYPDNPITVSPNWIHHAEVEITGAANPSVQSFATAVELLSKGIIVPERFISETYSLDEVEQAFEAAVRGDSYRVMVEM